MRLKAPGTYAAVDRGVAHLCIVVGDDVLRGKIPPHSIEHGVAEGGVTRAEHALRLCNILRVADLPFLALHDKALAVLHDVGEVDIHFFRRWDPQTAARRPQLVR